MKSPPAHAPGLLRKMTTYKGTGRVAYGASPDYKPRSPTNKLMKAAYGPDWRPKNYRRKK